MTITRILLLAQPAEGSALADGLRVHNPAVAVSVISDKAALVQLAQTDLSAARLLSFCSPLIVPQSLLSALPGPSYNFHPGPPDRPGRFPSAFAIYEKAERFGVTVHEMIEQIDAGPIVAAEWFTVPPEADVQTLEELAFGALIAIFRRLAPFLALNPLPLPRIYIPWSGRRRTKADRDALCRVTTDMPEDEVELRRRACGLISRA